MLSQDSDIVPATITTENRSNNAESYEWDFGDGNTSEDANPAHNYSLSGRYVVTLKAKAKNKVDIMTKEVVFEAPQDCQVILKTSMGEVVIELHDETPLHRDNFLKLIKENYFNDLLFHRVIKGFMVQGGDPNSKNAGKDVNLGGGGPGYTIPAEITETHVHYRGALAAARLGDQSNPEKKSSGSQFYVVHGGPVSEQSLDKQERQTGMIYSDEIRKNYYEKGGTPFLDFNYTVFGQVIKGFEIIDKIAKTPTRPGDRPVEDVKILEVVLIK